MRTSKGILSGVLLTALMASMVIFIAPHGSNAAQKIIMVDPGHGSAVNRREYEGARELAIGLKLKARLEKDGYKVVMSHTSVGEAINGYKRGDEPHDLYARADIANAAGASMIVSIHSDAHSQDGFEVIFPDVDVPDKGGVGGNHGASYLKNSKKMAQDMYDGLISGGLNTATSRPLHGEAYNNTSNTAGIGKPFRISAKSNVPVMTVEVYGHNSASLRAKYSQASTQDKVAAAIEKGVNNYFGSSNSGIAPKKVANNDTVSPQATPTGTPLRQGDPKCPTAIPSPGPAGGSDYQQQIAASINAQYSAIAQEAISGGADEGGATGTGQCALPIPNNTHVSSNMTSSRGRAQHRGLDFSAPTGAAVVAVQDATVILAKDSGFADGSGYWGNNKDNGGYGNYIRLKLDAGNYAEYHHLRTGSFKVKVGDHISKGQLIAQVDHNGWSSGSHLHFQMSSQNSSEQGYFDASNCLGLK